MISVARHPKNRLYIDSGASLHILFSKELLGELNNIKVPVKIQAGDKLFHIKQIGFLHQALRHLPLPVSAYHYSLTTNVLKYEFNKDPSIDKDATAFYPSLLIQTNRIQK